MNNLLTKMGRCAFLLGTVSLGLSLIAGCGSGTSSSGSTTPPMTGAVTPTVTVTASPSGSISTAQALSVAVAVASSAGAPAGSVVLSSGNYASFPFLVSGGQAVVSVPAGLLAVGEDTLTANFTPANTASYTSAAGTTNVTVLASGAATPVASASSVTYSTGGYGSPFRALPLASGNVLVSVSASTSGMLVFGPATGGGLQLSCFNYVRPQFVQDGASAFGMNLTPNGQGLAATLGVDGAIFYNLSTLQTCTSTGLQVSQGAVSAHEGSFDVVMSPDGKYAFVANEYGVAPGATAEGNVGVVALQYDSSGIVSTLWVSARGDNRVLAFSTGMLETNPGNALLGYADTGGTAPVSLRLFDSGKLLAVANSNRFGTGGIANATVLSVAVPASASVVQTISTGLFPREITVGSDDKTLYLTNYNSGSFQVISTTVQ